MIALLRIVAVAIFAVFTFIFGCGYSLLSPRNPKNLYIVGRMFAWMSKVFGIKIIARLPEGANERGQHIYVGNHQSNWDLCTISAGLTPNTVTVGKKSLVWIPLFGLLYWLTGNILIDRTNRTKAMGTIGQVAEKIKQSKVSVWMFPEGTRSRGRGLLPFKTGAFHAAIAAQVPIIPIVCSSTDHLKVNRWNNGHIIVEMLPPISVEGLEKEDVRVVLKQCRDQMKAKLDELDAEVKALNSKK